MNNPPSVPFFSALPSLLRTQSFFSSLHCSPHSFSILLSHPCLLLPFATFLFQVFILPFLASLSSLWCPFGQWRNPLAAGRGSMRAGLWLTALCGAGCLAFVPLPSKMEGTQRGGAAERESSGKEGGEEDQFIIHQPRGDALAKQQSNISLYCYINIGLEMTKRVVLLLL